MNNFKTVLDSRMDAMACQMDCHRRLKALDKIVQFAMKDIERSIEHNRQANIETEGQIKLSRLKIA